ncbi:MAG: hypothetical protein WBH97_00780 [Rectinemataceae bacterium]
MNSRIASLAIVLAFLGGGCLFAQESVSIDIEGLVPRMFQITSDMSETETIDLVDSSSAYLGKVVVFSNTLGTWTISIMSSNAGKMVGVTPGNSDVYPYLFSFGTIEDIDLSEAYRIYMNVTTQKTGFEYPVSVTYKKLDALPVPVYADYYRDTITITITVA